MNPFLLGGNTKGECEDQQQGLRTRNLSCSLVKQHRDEVQGEEKLPLPNRAADRTVGAEVGDCFMMIGREEGKLRPWSLSLMSFMAMENSSLSILPSLSVSARCLHEEEEEEEGRLRVTTFTYDFSENQNTHQLS